MLNIGRTMTAGHALASAALKSDNDATHRLAAANDAREAVQNQEARLEKLTLLTVALAELLQEMGVSEEKIVAKMQEIDLRDGALDGKIGAGIVTCEHCGQKYKASHRQCMYCGISNANPPAGSVLLK